MQVIFNNLIPFKGFAAINLFGIIFARAEYRKSINICTINHERIHTAQMKELGFIFFYIWYVLEWFIKLFIYGRKAYDNISFEREAYENQNDLTYLMNRKHYCWFKKLP